MILSRLRNILPIGSPVYQRLSDKVESQSNDCSTTDRDLQFDASGIHRERVEPWRVVLLGISSVAFLAALLAWLLTTQPSVTDLDCTRKLIPYSNITAYTYNSENGELIAFRSNAGCHHIWMG